MRTDEVLILGAKSPAGAHLTAALNRRNVDDQPIASAKYEERSFAVSAAEPSEADAVDMDALTQALEKYQLVFDCRIASGEDATTYPTRARNLAIAAVKTGVKVVLVSNYWSYLPVARLPIDEEHPRERGADWVKRRREGEDVLLAARAAVVHLPDFYGPSVHGGVVQQAIEEAYSRHVMRWAGPSAVEREYAFAPDAMESVARLAHHPEAFGQRWIVGGSGAISVDRIAGILGARLKKNVRVAALGSVGLRLRALYAVWAQERLRMPDSSEPISFNNQKLMALIGPLPPTSHEAAIARTIEWLERRRLVK